MKILLLCLLLSGCAQDCPVIREYIFPAPQGDTPKSEEPPAGFKQVKVITV